MDTRRFLIAITLSLLVMVVWGKLFPPPESPPTPARTGAEQTLPEPQGDTQEPTVEQAQGLSDSATDRAISDPVASLTEAAEPEVREERAEREERTVIETDSYRAELTNRGAQLISFQLAEHRNAAGGPVDLVRAREGRPYPFGLFESGGEPSPLNDALFTVEKSRDGDREVATYRYLGPAGEVTKRFAFGEGGLFDIEIESHDGKSRSISLGPGIRNPSAEELESRFSRKAAIYRTSDDTERLDPNRESETTLLPGGGLLWMGLQDNYFLTALIPKEPIDQVVVAAATG